MPENILIYYPPAKRSNVIETLACEFEALGNSVFLLTQDREDVLHEELKKNNIQVAAFPLSKTNAFLFYFKHLNYLIKFCRKNNIKAVQSHLQSANIIAVFAQYFIKAKVVVYRHHLIENNKTSKIFDRIINLLAKKIVVPSSVILNKMIQEEKVKEKKVSLIPYVYDFSKYSSSPNRIAEFRKLYSAKLLVLLCGRFVPLKRNDLAIKAVGELVKQNKDVKLLALDSGPGLEDSKRLVKDLGLSDHVFFIGYTPYVLDYIAACDVLVHPSYTEASNNTVKEAALFSKKVIVCEGVGDFSDYLIDGENGYLIERENPLPGMINKLNEIYSGSSSKEIGIKLKETVYQKFNKSSATINKHLDLLIH